MAWPQAVDYNAALQDPAACFADAELARGQVAEGLMPGIPLSYAGNFATVYKVEGPGGAWAVKCFTRKVENLAQRYKEISAHLARRRRRFAVEFQYLEEGVRVGGACYPVVKMQWVEGLTLNEFLRDRVGSPALLEQLAQLWVRLAAEMREDRMAHGDLQHGNVMLVPGAGGASLLLRLVDYDGMWAPAVAGLPPGEVGHPNYQHPQRLAEGGYGPDIDRFALLAVYTALRCLMVGGKALWAAFDNDENVLFREADFKGPARSKLFARLLTLPDAGAATLAARLLLACVAPLAECPPLAEVLDDGRVVPLSAEQRDRVLGLAPAAALPPPLPDRRTRLRPGVPADLAAATKTQVLDDTLAVAALSDAAVRPRGEPPPLPPRPAVAAPSTAPVRVRPPPGWLLALGLDPEGVPGRWWTLTLGGVLGALLFVLVVWLLWPAAAAPPPPAAVPRLLPPGGVSLRGGRAGETAVGVARESAAGELTLAVAGLPAGVECPPVRLPPGVGAAEVRLRWNVLAAADPFDGRVTLRLMRGAAVVDEAPLALRVAAFARPRLANDPPLAPVRLEPGQSVVVRVRVDPRGNADPWTLRIDPLPAGVRQRTPPTAVGAGMAAVELTADADAPEKEGLISLLSLFAGGVPADSANVVVSVQRPPSPPPPRQLESGDKGAVRVDIELPATAVRLAAGGKVALTVGLRRTGPAGVVRLGVEDLPAGVRAASVDVPASADSAAVELQADAGAGGRLELQSFRVVARAAGRVVGSQQGTFRLTRAEGPPAPPAARGIDVQFWAPDGMTLHGTLYRAADGRKAPCVLMVGEPAAGVSRQDPAWVRLAEALQQQGCCVLTFDFRGFGGSRDLEGRPPPAFWKVPANGKVLLPALRPRGAKRLAPPERLDGAQFPAAYVPWLVQDVVGARAYLDIKHETGVFNSQHLILIGAGEGAALACFWLAGEFHRRPAGPRGQVRPGAAAGGRDVVAAAWLDISPTLGKKAIPQGLAALRRDFAAEKRLPDMLFVHDAGSRERSRVLLRCLKQPERALKSVGGRGSRGQALLGEAGAEKAVLDFVAAVLEKHPVRPWAARGPSPASVWAFGKRVYPARGFLGPQPLPMDQLGFASLTQK
jgi:hypothetical protein